MHFLVGINHCYVTINFNFIIITLCEISFKNVSFLNYWRQNKMKRKRQSVNTANHYQHSQIPNHKTSFSWFQRTIIFESNRNKHKLTWFLQTPKSHTCPSNTARVVCSEKPTRNPLPQTFLPAAWQPAGVPRYHCSKTKHNHGFKTMRYSFPHAFPYSPVPQNTSHTLQMK